MGRPAALLLLLAFVTGGCGHVSATTPATSPATSAGPREPAPVYLVLKLGERRLYVRQPDPEGSSERVVASFPVAVGQRRWATPTGHFRVTEKVEDPDWMQFDWEDPSRVIRRVAPGRTNPLGARWIGFATAHGWGVGFHGTPHPELLGRAVSHGCVRMRNADVVDLYDRVLVGTPVIVEP